MAEIRHRINSRRPLGHILSNRDDLVEDHSMGNMNHHILFSPTFGFLILTIWSAFVFMIGLYFNDKLPNVDKGPFDKFHFNTDNVLKDLKVLNDFGPKVTGSQANEYEAVGFLSKRITDIKNEASSTHQIIFDLQKVSGKFSLHAFSKTFLITYENVQNVLVKIGPQVTSDNSLLINCHFDSVPTSPGASDDGLNCAVMLEILRVLSISEMELPHNIIFLFNGAEENPLIGSHGFITEHKWAPEVKTFINLESCGAGGREVLFQAGPNHPWLIQIYGKAVRYPSGLVIAEEIFQSGVIPSDTDFRIFRDFGKIPGLDFAHCKNGYVYHTKFDNIDSIESPHGVVKHTGENILSLSKALLFSKEFTNPKGYATGKEVYFDLFGLVFINYSSVFGTYLNILASLVSIMGIYFTISNLDPCYICRNIMNLLMALSSQLAFLIIACGYNLFVAFVLDLLGYSMSWFTNPLLLILIYVIPTVCFMAMNTLTVHMWILGYVSFVGKIYFSCLSVQLLWTTFLICTTIFLKIRSSFLILIIVLPSVLWTFFTSLMKFRGNYKVWHVSFILISSFSSCMVCYLGITSLRLFIPITGRIGVNKNPEFLIGMLTTLLSIAVFSYISTLFAHVKNQWILMKALFGLHLLTFVVILLPIGFPFSIKTPQRIFVTHVNRQFFDIQQTIEYSDSLFWIQNMDRRGRSILPFLEGSQLLDEFCEENGYCGLPWFSKIKEKSGSTCIPSAPHKLRDYSSLELVSKQLEGAEFLLKFRVSGPDHMGIVITPSENVTLLDWNLPSSIEQSSNTISFVQGLHNSSQIITVKANKHSPDSFIKVEIYGLYFHHNEYFSIDFNNLLLKFPKWSHVSPALAVYKSYMF